MFWPFSTGVLGGVWSGRIRLRSRTWLFEYNAKPVLSGRIRDADGGCTLDLRYRAPAWVYVFYLFWYASLISMGVAVLGGLVATDAGESEALGPIAVVGVLLIAPIALHVFGTRHSDADLDELLSFLERFAEAKR